MYDEPLFLTAGDRALVVEFGNSISPEINARVHNLTVAIERSEADGVVEIVPTYRSLMVHYDPARVTASGLEDHIRELGESLDEQVAGAARVVRIPTLYGGEHGPDLEFVAQNAGMAVDEAVAAHSGTDYLVYMIGFSPGFPYLGGLSDRLVTPRLGTPRPVIPAGSVGIAESQTGVYPVASPGGWRLIGRTPLKMFDATREPPALLSAGDFVRFAPIDTEDEFQSIQSSAEEGRYEIEATPL